MDYVLKQVVGAGRPSVWTSDVVFAARDLGDVKQAVIAGFLNGESRWAETPDGAFLYGLDGKGRELKAPPPSEQGGSDGRHQG